MGRAGKAILLLWLVAAGLWAGSQPVLADDAWWVLASGRYIVESGVIPLRDVFSYSAQGHIWYQQEWLAYVLFYSAMRTFGPDGLIVVKIAIGVAIIVLLGWIAARRSGSPFFGSLAAVFAAWACRDDLDVRAKIFTVLLSTALLGVLYAYRRGAAARILLLVPCLMMAWVNLHYGFPYGLVIVAAAFGTETVKSLTGLPDAPMPLRRSLLLGGALVLGVLACFANPQMGAAFEIPLEHFRSANPWLRVIEWKPPRLLHDGWPTPFLVSLAVQASAAAIALVLVPRRFDVSDFAIAAATGMIALDSRRFAPLFAFVAAPLLARNLALIAQWLGERRPALARAGPRVATAVAAAGALLTGGVFVAHARSAFAPGLFRGATYLASFPGDAVDFIRTSGLPVTRLYNFYPWGGYLLFALPGMPIYVDGRASTAYPRKIANEYGAIESASPRSLALLDRYGTDGVLHHARTGLPMFLRRSPQWVRVYDDGLAVVFVRRTPHTAAWLERFERGAIPYPDSPGAQLFLAELEMRRGKRGRALQRASEVLRRFPKAGAEVTLRRQDIELSASLGAEPEAARVLDLYATALAIAAGH